MLCISYEQGLEQALHQQLQWDGHSKGFLTAVEDHVDKQAGTGKQDAGVSWLRAQRACLCALSLLRR